MQQDEPTMSPEAFQPADSFDVEQHKLPVLACSIVVGLLTGLVGTLFQLGIREAVAGLTWAQQLGLAAGLPGWLVPAVASALLAWAAILLVRLFAPEASGSGVHEIEGALSGVRPVRWERVLPVKFFGGLMAISAGMVLGREGPTVQMGGNLGQMVGRALRLHKDQLHILLASGAGAGIAAAFNAPLAGILFVIEEMRPHFRYGFLSVQSVVIACGASAFVLRRMTGQAPDLPITQFNVPPLESLGLFLLLGLLFGVIGFLFNKALVRTLDLFAHMRGHLVWIRGLTVGAAVGIVSWKYPHAVGDGYQTIVWAIKTHPTATMLLGIFAARFVAGMLCYGCGAPGGIFAPMLALATLFGMAYGKTMKQWFPGMEIEAGMFAVAGMGALFAATVRAPLTGIALTIELTQNYELVLPLILTCWAATIVAQGLGARPIYTVLLERTLRGTGTSGGDESTNTTGPSDR